MRFGPVHVARHVLGDLCSTPYGDNAIWTLEDGAIDAFLGEVLNALRRQCDLDIPRAHNRVLCSVGAQRLTATMRFGLGAPGTWKDLLFVLNALRRQCDLDQLSNEALVNLLSAQRLTATMRFGPVHRALGRIPELLCSTPYGDNAIWTDSL